MFNQLFEDIGSMKANIKSIDEKQDMLLRMLEEQAVKKAEFSLFKKVFFSAMSIIVASISFIYIQILGK
jgi:hypothetical protein